MYSNIAMAVEDISKLRKLKSKSALSEFPWLSFRISDDSKIP